MVQKLGRVVLSPPSLPVSYTDGGPAAQPSAGGLSEEDVKRMVAEQTAQIRERYEAQQKEKGGNVFLGCSPFSMMHTNYCVLETFGVGSCAVFSFNIV